MLSNLENSCSKLADIPTATLIRYTDVFSTNDDTLQVPAPGWSDPGFTAARPLLPLLCCQQVSGRENTPMKRRHFRYSCLPFTGFGLL